MADPCEGHYCDGCKKCQSGTCCQRDRIFWKPKAARNITTPRTGSDPAQYDGQADA